MRFIKLCFILSCFVKWEKAGWNIVKRERPGAEGSGQSTLVSNCKSILSYIKQFYSIHFT